MLGHFEVFPIFPFFCKSNSNLQNRLHVSQYDIPSIEIEDRVAAKDRFLRCGDTTGAAPCVV